MFHQMVKLYLRWTAKEHLVPFVEGLANIGRPSATLFPTELIEQGLGLLLSGLNNTLAIQTNPDWVWPNWVERQLNPDAPEFPTGVNLVTANIALRNWTSLGLAASTRESMIDRVGMLTLRPFGWSVFPYLRWNGKGYFPPRLHASVRQSLREGILPCVVTRYEISPHLLWSSEAMAIVAEGEELVSFLHRLQNLSASEMELIFGLAIRPYNPLTIGHINRIKFKRRLWRINGRPGLLLFEEPSQIAVSDRHHGDPLLERHSPLDTTSLTSKSGIACGVAEYLLRLAPSEERIIEAAGTVAKLGNRPNLKFRHITPNALEMARARELDFWEENSRKGLTLALSDPEIERAFYAVKNHLHVYDDGDHFSPGTFLYHSHWFRDSFYIALAHDNLGAHACVRPKLLKYLDYQTSDGFFKSHSGEWDSNGQAILAIVNHVRRTGDLELLRACYSSIVKGVRWIEEMRGRTRRAPSRHYALLPAGFSAEHFGPNDHYYWDNFWSLAGVRAALWAARRLGLSGDVGRLKSIYVDYRYHLSAAIRASFERTAAGTLPCSPYRPTDSAAVGNLAAVSPLAIVSPSLAWVRNTVEYLVARNLRNGLFFQNIIHTGLNPYLSIQLARALMALRDPRWLEILQALLRHCRAYIHLA